MNLAILIFCILFIAYVYLGYPALLWFFTRNKKLEYPLSKYEGDISVVMVICNESRNVEKKINNLLALNYTSGNIKLIIVDDASDDRSRDIISRFTNKVLLIKSPSRLGKASGLNLAMKHVETELVMFTDCRQTLQPNVMDDLSSWFAADSLMGAVSGELMFKSENANDFSDGMDGYWKYEKFIRKSEAILASVPGVSGALYMLRACTYQYIPSDTLLDDVQIPMVCVGQGYRVSYDDRAIAWDVPSTSLSREKSRKIRTLSGNYQLLFRFPKWVIPGGHPIWWQFLSHKIFRLLAPFVAIISVIAAFFVHEAGSYIGTLYMVSFVAAVSAAPLGMLIPILNRVKIIKLLGSFITLNWFCLLAFFNYFFTRQVGSWKK